MNRIIRKNVFETNSSSAHSLVMDFSSSKEDIKKSISKYREKKSPIVVTLRGYYNNPNAYSLEDKLSYIFSDVLEGYSHELILTTREKEIPDGLPIESVMNLVATGFGLKSHVNEKVLNNIKENNPKFKKLWDLVEKETGCEIIVTVEDKGDCYVDHESKFRGAKLLDWEEDKILEFLFDSRNYFDLHSC